MTNIVYRPGSWQVVVESSGMIAVPGETAPDRLARLAEMLRTGVPGLTEVIDVLADGSITALGSFAVALTGSDGVRFAVRGPVSVHIAGVEDGRVVSGADVTTWSERFVVDPRGYEVLLDEQASPAEYPIRSGIVLAGAVRAGETEGAAPETAAVEEPVGAPAASPTTSVEPPVVKEPVEEPVADGPVVEEPVEEPVAEAVDEPVAEQSAAEEQPVPEELTEDTVSDDLAMTQNDALGDHDGATISVAEARRLRAAASAPDLSFAPPPPAAAEAPTEVLPVVGAPAAQAGRIRLSTGEVVELDRTVIIGRRPRSTRASGTTMPHLIAVESPQQDISRSHLEIRPEGDSVVVIDLHTTNGSTLHRPGTEPMRLHPGEQTLVLDGDTVDLGDGVIVGFEGLA